MINAGNQPATTNNLGQQHVRNNNGHGVTNVLPSNADAVTVQGVTLPFQQAPATQSGGVGGPAPTAKARGGRITTDNAKGNARG